MNDPTHSADAVPNIIEKVTAFITRPSNSGIDLLLLQHPYAGIQIPAGTVEADETPETAVLREAWEETGLRELKLARCLGARDDPPLPGHLIVSQHTTVYARPDTLSFDRATLPRGAMVRLEREADGYTQVTYTEPDRVPDPSFVTYQITGWVANSVLATSRTRHFYHLECHEPTEESWEGRN